MIKTAVILTVFNRREVTLKGLRSLHRAIVVLGEGYTFDVYMTDDGCTDGTGEAVANEFPDIKIIKGDGNLYWSGGMRKAWQMAIDSGIEYDFYLWFNDDADLYEDALVTMFNSEKEAGGNAIISGAFCDNKGKVSYGGWDKRNHLIIPNETLRPIHLMNGNLVVVPKCCVGKIGIIDHVFIHSLGDWDYGRRAQKKGINVFLSTTFVGVTVRHDDKDNKCFSTEYSLLQRCKYYIKTKKSSKAAFIYDIRHDGIIMAVLRFFKPFFYIMFPSCYKFKH